MNIYDIAKEAGVSIATVSRVLNNKGTVSPTTRARVEAVLEKNRYAPSAIARCMVGLPMKKIAVLTVDIREPHYARTAFAIEQTFSQKGYEVILCNTGNSMECAMSYLQSVRNKQVDGIILIGSVFNAFNEMPSVRSLLNGIPVVLANGHLHLPNCYSVEVDDESGIAMATAHLLERGRRSIIYAKDLDTASAQVKCKGYEKTMKKAGLPERVMSVEYGLQGGDRFAEKLVQSDGDVDAIVCGEDLTAAGIVNGLQRRGVRVPGDVAVTGYNGTVFASICSPVLTTVDNFPEEAAMHCVRILEQLLEGSGGGNFLLTPKLIYGQST